MKQKIVFLSLLLSLLFSQNASAFCNSVSTRVYVTMNPGNVKYITTRSRDDFIRNIHTKHRISPNTLGLTVANLTIKGEARPRVDRENNQICVSIDSLSFKMGYDDLTVYIDKKYKPSTCEYKVIKAHENYHVKVAQQGMIFFKPDIERQIQKSLEKIRPQIVTSEAEKEKVLEGQFQQIMDDLQPLIDHINKVLAQKNYEIDTPESYEKTKALCQNW